MSTAIRPTNTKRTWTTTLVAITVLLLAAGALSAQPNTAKVNRLSFDLDDNDAGTLSSNAQTLTVNLPYPAQIGNTYPGRAAKMRLAFQNNGKPRPQARFVQAQASHYRVSCYIPSGYQSAPVTFTCAADPTWLRTLKAKTTVRIEVGGAGVEGKLQANWVFQPKPVLKKRR